MGIFVAMVAFSLPKLEAESVTAWGFNSNGQTAVPAGLDAVRVAAGGYHSLALRSNGTVVGWGHNNHGQATVPAGLDAVAIDAGTYHSLALVADGTVVAWGNNTKDQTVIPEGLADVTAVAAGGYHNLALRSDGTVVGWGDDWYGQAWIPTDLVDVTAVAAGENHSLALRSDGTVVAWGDELYGQISVPEGLGDVVAIAAGGYHSLALRSDGTVMAWGYDSNGQSRVPAGLTGVTAIAGGTYHSVALKSDGTVVAWGRTRNGEAVVPAGVSGVRGISAGFYHTLAAYTPAQGPVAVAGADQRAVEGALITLDAGASYDANNPPRVLTAPVWTQVAGPTVQLSNANAFITTLVTPIVPASGAVLTFKFSVSNGVATSSDTVNVIIDNVNSAPSANAGINQAVNEATIVTLSGGGTDPDGDMLTLAWTQIGGPAVLLDGADTDSPSFVAPAVTAAEGAVDLTFRLTVNDGTISSGPSDVVVHVVNSNDPPVANAGVDRSVGQGELVTLNGSGTSDPNDDVLTYSWAQVGGSPAVSLTDANTALASFTAPTVPFGGTTLSFRLTVSDGELGSSSTVNVRITNTNNKPLADAGPDQTVPERAEVTLSGAASADLDGDTLAYVWKQSGGPAVQLLGSSTTTPTFTAPDVSLSGALLSFRLTVFDAFGGTGTDEVNVRVNDSNRPPVANAGADQTNDEGVIVTLQGSATDPDGQPLTFAWVQVSGPVVTLSDTASPNPTFTAPLVTRAGGALVFRLMASDPFSGKASDDVTVHIANVNHAPTAQAPANFNVPEDEPVALIGSGADPDQEEQSQLTYLWQQIAGPQVTLVRSGANINFIAPTLAPGGDPTIKATLAFKLTVTDPNQAVAVDEVQVIVANIDHSPIANAGGSLGTNEASTVTLNGSASSDPDGDPLTYSWSQVSGTPVQLGDANTPYPYFVAPFVSAAGTTLTFKLTVDDRFGGISSDTATVTVANINDPPSITNAYPSIAILWPANQDLSLVSILGITDPNNNATVVITGVTQDEPTSDKSGNGKNGSDVPIDAVINPDGTVLLRAERSNKGDGRVYRVSFKAFDFEGSSSGVVKVSVPRSPQTQAVDSGGVYDSTR